jgi:protocatechuate 3,4-dioxygenase beta subunit
VDPRSGPVNFSLKPQDLDRRDPGLVFRGRVLDEAGDPVAGAVVEPFGFTKGNTGRFGRLEGFDELAVTNDKGEFRLGVPEPGLELHVQASAPLLAPRRFAKLAVGAKGHDLALSVGVTVSGRVLKDGKPLAGAALGLVQKDRGVDAFFGEFRTGTDAEGKFAFRNVPPGDAFVLYGSMDGLRAHGAIAVRDVRTGASKSGRNVGDLAVQPGHRLTGRVVLSDGQAVPAGTTVSLSREEAWDVQAAEVDKDGGFVLDGLPTERYSLAVRVKGYHVSPKNDSYDLLNRLGLIGVVRSDIKGLRLLLEAGPLGPAPDPRKFDRKDFDEYRRRRESPLRGNEGEPSK